jgi:hypothetical protein
LLRFVEERIGGGFETGLGVNQKTDPVGRLTSLLSGDGDLGPEVRATLSRRGLLEVRSDDVPERINCRASSRTTPPGGIIGLQKSTISVATRKLRSWMS